MISDPSYKTPRIQKPVPPDREANRQLLHKVAESEGVDPDFIEAAFGQEPGFNNKAVSPKGARGGAQIIPGTAVRLARQLGTTLHNPETNYRAGVVEFKNGIEEGVRKGVADPKVHALIRDNSGRDSTEVPVNQLPEETRKYVPAIQAKEEQVKRIRAQQPVSTEQQPPAVSGPSSAALTKEPVQISQPAPSVFPREKGSIANSYQTPRIGQSANTPAPAQNLDINGSAQPLRYPSDGAPTSKIMPAANRAANPATAKNSETKLDPAMSKTAKLAATTSSADEQAFQNWYKARAEKYNLDPNPDAPRHKYDYRAAFRAGADVDPATGHWPSAFKASDHPNRYVEEDGKVIDSISGRKVSPGFLRRQRATNAKENENRTNLINTSNIPTNNVSAGAQASAGGASASPGSVKPSPIVTRESIEKQRADLVAIDKQIKQVFEAGKQKKLNAAIGGLRQVESRVEIPGYKESVTDANANLAAGNNLIDTYNQKKAQLNADIAAFNQTLLNKPGKKTIAQYDKQGTAAPPKASFHEVAEINAGEPMSEAQTYAHWNEARRTGNVEAQQAIARAYIEQFSHSTDPESTARLQAVKGYTPKRITDNEAEKTGAFAAIPVAEILKLRKQRVPDAQILRNLQDRIAGEMGLSPAETQLLTDKFGEHPLGKEFLAGSGQSYGNPTAQINGLIAQGQSALNQDEKRQGLGSAEFSIPGAMVARIREGLRGVRPVDNATRQAVDDINNMHYGSRAFLRDIAIDPHISKQTPEISAIAGLLSESPKTLRLFDDIGAGGMAHIASISQTISNIGEYLKHPLKRGDELLSDFLTNGQLTKKGALTPMPESDAAKRFSEYAQNLGESRPGEPPSSEAVKKWTKSILDMFPFMLTAEVGGIGGVAAYGFAEKAHEGTGAATLSALTSAGPFAIVAKSPLGGYLHEAVLGKLKVSPELARYALYSGTEEQAIDSAAKLVRAQLLAEVTGISAQGAANAAQFLATSAAITGVKEGRAMTAEEIKDQVLMLVAMEALPAIRKMAEIPGSVRGIKNGLTTALEQYRFDTAIDVTPGRSNAEKAAAEADAFAAGKRVREGKLLNSQPEISPDQSEVAGTFKTSSEVLNHLSRLPESEQADFHTAQNNDPAFNKIQERYSAEQADPAEMEQARLDFANRYFGKLTENANANATGDKGTEAVTIGEDVLPAGDIDKAKSAREAILQATDREEYKSATLEFSRQAPEGTIIDDGLGNQWVLKKGTTAKGTEFLEWQGQGEEGQQNPGANTFAYERRIGKGETDWQRSGKAEGAAFHADSTVIYPGEKTSDTNQVQNLSEQKNAIGDDRNGQSTRQSVPSELVGQNARVQNSSTPVINPLENRGKSSPPAGETGGSVNGNESVTPPFKVEDKVTSPKLNKGNELKIVTVSEDGRELELKRTDGKGKSSKLHVDSEKGKTLQRVEAPRTEIDEVAHESAASPENDRQVPTQAQKDAGNFKMGHATIGGLDVSLEYPAGVKRKEHHLPLASHYGYIPGYKGADGEFLDTFVKPGTTENYSGPVFVVDQNKADGSFDEQKVMLGYVDEDAARKGYLANFPDGWKGLQSIHQFENVSAFRDWLKSTDMSRSVSDNLKPATEEMQPASLYERARQFAVSGNRVTSSMVEGNSAAIDTQPAEPEAKATSNPAPKSRADLTRDAIARRRTENSQASNAQTVEKNSSPVNGAEVVKEETPQEKRKPITEDLKRQFFEQTQSETVIPSTASREKPPRYARGPLLNGEEIPGLATVTETGARKHILVNVNDQLPAELIQELARSPYVAELSQVFDRAVEKIRSIIKKIDPRYEKINYIGIAPMAGQKTPEGFTIRHLDLYGTPGNDLLYVNPYKIYNLVNEIRGHFVDEREAIDYAAEITYQTIVHEFIHTVLVPHGKYFDKREANALTYLDVEGNAIIGEIFNLLYKNRSQIFKELGKDAARVTEAFTPREILPDPLDTGAATSVRDNGSAIDIAESERRGSGLPVRLRSGGENEAGNPVAGADAPDVNNLPETLRNGLGEIARSFNEEGRTDSTSRRDEAELTPDLLNQSVKSAAELIKEGRALIHAFQSANLSTNPEAGKNAQPVTDAKSLRRALKKANPHTRKQQLDRLEVAIDALAKEFVKTNPAKTEADFYRLIAGSTISARAAGRNKSGYIITRESLLGATAIPGFESTISSGTAKHVVVNVNNMLPPELVDEIARKPYIAKLSKALEHAVETVKNRMKELDSRYEQTEYIGLGLTNDFLGSHVYHQELFGGPGPNLVYLNPHRVLMLAHEIRGYYPEDDFPMFYASHILDTIVHEICHSAVRREGKFLQDRMDAAMVHMGQGGIDVMIDIARLISGNQRQILKEIYRDAERIDASFRRGDAIHEPTGSGVSAQLSPGRSEKSPGDRQEQGTTLRPDSRSSEQSGSATKSRRDGPELNPTGLDQHAKGAAEFIKDGRALIHTFQSANLSTNADAGKNVQPVTDAKSLRRALKKANPHTRKQQLDRLEVAIDALAKEFVKTNPAKTEADFYKLIAGSKKMVGASLSSKGSKDAEGYSEESLLNGVGIAGTESKTESGARKHIVVNVNDQLPAKVIKEIANAPYVAKLSKVFDGTVEKIKQKLKEIDERYENVEYIGIAPGDAEEFPLGFNVKHEALYGKPGKDLIYLNPYEIYNIINENRGYFSDINELVQAVATHIYATTVHETIYAVYMGHGQDFEDALEDATIHLNSDAPGIIVEIFKQLSRNNYKGFKEIGKHAARVKKTFTPRTILFGAVDADPSTPLRSGRTQSDTENGKERRAQHPIDSPGSGQRQTRNSPSRSDGIERPTLNQNVKGAVEFLQDERALTHMFQSADTPTVVQAEDAKPMLGTDAKTAEIVKLARGLADNLGADYNTVLSVVNEATEDLDRNWPDQVLEEFERTPKIERKKIAEVLYGIFRRRTEEIRGDGRASENLERRVGSGQESSAAQVQRQQGRVSSLSEVATRADASENRDGARHRDGINLEADKNTSSNKFFQNAKGTIEFPQDGHALIHAFQPNDISTVEAEEAIPIAVTDAKTAAAAWAQVAPNTSAEQVRVLEQVFDALAKGFVKMNPGKMEADYYQRIAFQKGGKVDGDALYHEKPPVMFSSRNIGDAIEAKRQLKATGFPKAKITEFINLYYNRESYKTLLQGQDNVYLVMPSTSSKNEVPLHLAERLQRDFGGVVENKFATTLAEKEAKLKRTLSERIVDPIDFDVFEDLSKYRGKNIVIVDDIFTTGESTSALRIALRQEGIEAAHTAVLVSAANHQIYEYYIAQLARGLADSMGADYNAVLSVVNEALEGLNRNWFNRALEEFERTPRSERKKIAEHFYGFFRTRAEKIRGNGRGTENLERRSRSREPSTDTSVRGGRVSPLSSMAARPDAQGNREGVESREESNLESDKDPPSDKLSQDAKGAVEFLEDGRAIIHAFESADLSTVLHELGHIARRYLDAKSLAIIENWAGVENGLWSRKAEEKFARYFERYLRTGKAPGEKLKSAFAKIKEWMREIYRTLRGSLLDINVNPQVERVFARILGIDFLTRERLTAAGKRQFLAERPFNDYSPINSNVSKETTIYGAPQQPRIAWSLNPGGEVKTNEEAVGFAKKTGVDRKASESSLEVAENALQQTVPEAGEQLLNKRTGEVAAQIRSTNIEDQVIDKFTAEQLGKAVVDNPVAYRAYRQIQSEGINVVLDFGTMELDLQGLAEPQLGRVTIFMKNNANVAEAVESVVHESSHIRQFFRGKPIGTLKDEFRAVRREFLFRQGRRPTRDEVRDIIWPNVRQRYPGLE